MALTDGDRDYLAHLIRSQTGELKTDMRWIKLLSAFALTVVGGVLSVSYPLVSGLNHDVEVLQGKIMKYEADHLKCHMWKWQIKGDKDDNG